MNIGICIVLIKSFIEKNQYDLLMLGSPKDIFAEVYMMAEDQADDEIIECLTYIDKIGMVNNCFRGGE